MQNMEIFLLLATSAFGPAVKADTAPDAFALYAPVLADARTQRPVRPEWPLLLDAVVGDDCIGDCERKRHDPALLGRLIEAKMVVDTFSGDRRRTACPVRTCTFVRLGSILLLPPRTPVKFVPGGRVPGTSLDRALAAVPDSLAVPVDAAVDIILHTPCPEPPESDRCRMPDIVGYRYFLQRQPDGSFVVMGRWFTYAV